jgi:hypothetical protein
VRTECGQSVDSADTSGRFPVEFRGEFSDCPSKLLQVLLDLTPVFCSDFGTAKDS